jgi:hypothetical protein
MWLAAGYFDESTDEFEDRCFTVAGFIGPHFAGLSLDMKWKDRLEEWNLDYFKASEIEGGFGQFAQYRDDPNALTKPLSAREKDLIKAIKTSFVDLICDEDEMTGIGAVLLLRDYQVFKLQEPKLAAKLPNPYTLCGQFVMMEAGFEMLACNERYPTRLQGLMRPVFDSHEDYSFKFQHGFDSFCKKNPTCSQFLLPPIYEDDQTYHCLQAADCLAYEARRLVDNALFDPKRPERVAMARLRQTVSKIYFIKYDGLKLIAEKQRPDFISLTPALENKRRF